MKKLTSIATSTAILALLPAQAVMAQDLSSEVSPATVWFALLVVVFALLVAVGLFMARDVGDEPPIKPARKQKPALLPRSHPRKQQEFS